MDRSLSNPFPNIAGLTLIEILVALAIISIALTAVIKAASQNIRATTYLQNKTIATWVGLEVLNKAKIELLTLPNAPDKESKTETMLGHTWYWQAFKQETPNKQIYKTEVNVFYGAEEEQPLVTLQGFLYHAN